jgi:hypothetical protein
MKMNKILLYFILPQFIFSYGIAQDKLDIKFGKISAKDFEKKVYEIDENAGAVIIADIGTSYIESNTSGWFDLVYKHYRRVHILNKSGYDLANVSVLLYTSGNSEETLEKVKASTYNLENGKIVESKLETKSGIFKDKYDKNWVSKKFTLPNVKEGSIIEYEFTIISGYFRNFRSWRFQGTVPRLWSEYDVDIPEFFNYVFLSSGYKTYHIRKTNLKNKTFHINIGYVSSGSSIVQLPATISNHRWVMKNVPALKEEPYTTSIENHIAKIEFRLSTLRFPDRPPIDVMGNWTKVGESLMDDEDFGLQLGRSNNWLDADVKAIMGNSSSPEEKARKIFAFVRDNFICTSPYGLFMTTNPRNTLKNKKGTVADINLLLICMLRNQGIQADPVIVGTRENGSTQEIYPILNQYNKVICMSTISGKTYYLDASRPRLGFGYLPSNCYNGHARRISKISSPVYLVADSLRERKVTSVIMISNEEASGWQGAFTSLLGYYESLDLRDNIKEKGKEEFVKTIRKEYSQEFDIKTPHVDSLEMYDEPVQVKYDFSYDHGKEDIIYFNPMMAEGYKENPFKSAKRLYPVEMPYIFDETYILSLEIPEGYVLDEMPKPMVLKLNENEDGLFEYRISSSGGNVALRSRIRIKRTLFAPEEYELLREFFNMAVSKQAEQLVFKKKKQL